MEASRDVAPAAQGSVCKKQNTVRGPVAAKGRNAQNDAQPRCGFRPFYRNFLPTSSSSLMSPPQTGSGQGRVTSFLQPEHWRLYAAWLHHQQQTAIRYQPTTLYVPVAQPYFSQQFPASPSWTVKSSPSMVLHGEHLPLKSTDTSPSENKFADITTVKNARSGPKEMSTPPTVRQVTVVDQSEPEETAKIVGVPSSDSDSESVGKDGPVAVQNPGYTSDKSDSEDVIDVCS